MAENYDFLRTFTFDGKETNHLFQIAKVNIPFMSKDNDFYTVGNTDARHFRNTKLGEHSISIDGFVIKDNTGKSVSESLDELKLILNSDEPKQLIFDLFPERYFNAIYSGVQEYDATNLDYTPLTLVFDVPDALSHAIHAKSYSNVYTTGTNMVLDSEYKNPKKYMAQWARVLEDKHDNSAVIQGDLSEGTPYGYRPVDQYYWVNNTEYTRRNIQPLTKGQKVFFSIDAQALSADSDANITKAGMMRAELWQSKPLKLVKRVDINIPKNATSWANYQTLVEVPTDTIDMINLAYCLNGKAKVNFSKPMMTISDNSIPYVASQEGLSDVVSIKNNGTYRTYPKFSFTMNGENGLVGLINQNGGILQFGNPEDVDGTTPTRQEFGLRENFYGSTLNPNIKVNQDFKSVYPNMNSNPSTPNLFQGSWNMTDDIDSATPQFATAPTQEVWHGPSMVLPIQAPSDNNRAGNFRTHIRFNFDNRSKRARGRTEVSVMDTNGNYVMGAVIRDSDNTSDSFVFESWYKDTLVNSQTITKRVFNKAFCELVLYRTGKELLWKLTQIKSLNANNTTNDDKVIWVSWNLDAPDTSNINTVGVWQMRHQNSQHVLMNVTDVQARWSATSYYQDIKNQFQDGDIVEVDVASRSLFINGSVNNTLNVVGNEWEKFVCEPGDTVIQPVYSSWANMPAVTGELREVFL